MGKEVRDDSLWENVRGNTGRDGGITPGQNGAKRNKGGAAASPVAQSATKVCVCLRTIPSLSLGRGSLRMMCSTKSLGVTEAMFHFNFPSTTSSQSWKQKERIKWSFISNLENPSSDPLPFFFSPGNGSATLLHFPAARCILLSACLSHSSHPLCSYRQHVTSFALLRGPANETSSSFLPVTSLQRPQWASSS